MKRIISVLMIIILLMSMVACENKDQTSSKNNNYKNNGYEYENDDFDTEYQPSDDTVDEEDSLTNTEIDTERESVKNSAISKAQNHQYLDAIKILDDYLESIYTNDEELSNLFYDYISAYCDEQILAAENAFVNPAEDYEKSLSIINNALQHFPGDEGLLNKKEYYSSFAPVNLRDMLPYDGNLSVFDDMRDIFGNTHYNGYTYASWFGSYRDSYGAFDLGRKYNTFKATIFPRNNETGFIRIYADGICVYENPNIKENTRPFTITADITGASDLEIEFGGSTCLTEVIVQKTVK